jgi:hypothetical protein
MENELIRVINEEIEFQKQLEKTDDDRTEAQL